MNAILIVNKESGITSNHLIQRIKRTLKVNKIGHAGTLDPDAKGVMIVLLGEATKLSDYLLNDDKEYLAEVVIGEARDTEDASGTIINKVEVVTINDVDEVLKSLIGKQTQTPPMYSAIKQDGKKLYELARQGITVERKVNNIEIFSLNRTSDIIISDGLARFTIKTKVSKGTYIRTLSVLIGELLGYPSHMGSLTRTASGVFSIDQSYSLEDIEQGNFKTISLIDALDKYEQIEVDEDTKRKILNGQALDKDLIKSDNKLIVLKSEGNLLGIYEYIEGKYKARRVWN